MKRVYFDNAATTVCYPQAAIEVNRYLTEEYANASSVHAMGFEARKVMKECEENLLRLLEINDDRRVIFTSGATESVNMALKGTVFKYTHPENTNIVTTVIEHPCVTNTFNFLETLNVDTRFVTVDENGVINYEDLESKVDQKTKIVSIIYVNNEFGIVQDIKRITETVKAINENVLVHVDATQAVGKLHPDLCDADMISVSAHKFHGPKGIGALVLKKNITLSPLLHGGGQQDGYRSGTINTPLIAGMNRAAELSCSNLEENMAAVREVFDYAVKKLKDEIPGVKFNTPLESVISGHILNISLPGFKGEVLLHMLEEHGIFVSVSSACSSRNSQVGSILKELGKTDEEITGTLRLSFSGYNSLSEIDYFIEKLKVCIKRLKLLNRIK